MPKIKINGLSTYVPGQGFGSDIITPTVPAYADLGVIHLYGENYNSELSDAKIKYTTSLPSLPEGMTMGDNGIISEEKRSNTSDFYLPDVLEVPSGTMFYLMTVTPRDQSGYSSDRGELIGSDKRLSVGCRYYGADADSGVVPFSYGTAAVSLVTGNDSNAPVAVEANLPIAAQPISQVIMLAVTKNKATGEVEGFRFSGDNSGFGVTPFALSGTESYPVYFNAGTGLPEVTLHCAGQYTSPLTSQQVNELWLTLKKTVGSAGANV